MKQLFLILLFTSLNFAQTDLLLLMGDDIKPYYAIDIAGATEYGRSTASPNLTAKTFTIMGWFKTPATLATRQSILSSDADITNNGWALVVEDDGDIFFSNDNFVGTNNTYNADLEANTWYFIVIVCVRTNQTINDYLCYVDGTQKTGTVSIESITMPNNTNPLLVGGHWWSGNGVIYEPWSWLGQIGEMQIVSGYNLSEAEINAVMTSGFLSSYTSGTVTIWYKWSGATDAVMLKDYSASGFDLTGNNLTTADQVEIGATYK